MGELTESSNIAELIDSLIGCWYRYNSTHQTAIDDSKDVSYRCLCGKLAEDQIGLRYSLVNQIDEEVERIFAKS